MKNVNFVKLILEVLLFWKKAFHHCAIFFLLSGCQETYVTMRVLVCHIKASIIHNSQDIPYERCSSGLQTSKSILPTFPPSTDYRYLTAVVALCTVASGQLLNWHGLLYARWASILPPATDCRFFSAYFRISELTVPPAPSDCISSVLC